MEFHIRYAMANWYSFMSIKWAIGIFWDVNNGLFSNSADSVQHATGEAIPMNELASHGPDDIPNYYGIYCSVLVIGRKKSGRRKRK